MTTRLTTRRHPERLPRRPVLGRTLHLPCVSTAFVAKPLPLHYISTAFAVGKTVPLPCVFHCLRGQATAFALRFHCLCRGQDSDFCRAVLRSSRRAAPRAAPWLGLAAAGTGLGRTCHCTQPALVESAISTAKPQSLSVGGCNEQRHEQ